MNTPLSTATELYLEPGDIVGRRLLITERCVEDPAWPYRATDLDQGGHRFQLAVHEIGPWQPGVAADEQWPLALDSQLPTPSGSHPSVRASGISAASGCSGESRDSGGDVIEVYYSPPLRHDGGVIMAAAIPDYAPPEGWREADRGGTISEPMSAVAVASAIDELRQLHRMTGPVEALHRGGHAHGAVTRESFRVDEATGAPLIRPAPALRPEPVTIAEQQGRDIRSLQRMVAATTHPGVGPGGRRVCVVDDGPDSPIRALLRAVLRRPTPLPAEQTVVIAVWRAMLDRLIRVAEVKALTDAARNHRREVVTELLCGRFDRAVGLCDNRNDTWSEEMATRLRDRQHSVHRNYERWCADHRDLPLSEAAARLEELRSSGFCLPDACDGQRFIQRLATCIPHLREAAASLREGAWSRAYAALSVAATLDPGNPALAGLSAIVARRSRLDEES